MAARSDRKTRVVPGPGGSDRQGTGFLHIDSMTCGHAGGTQRTDRTSSGLAPIALVMALVCSWIGCSAALGAEPRLNPVHLVGQEDQELLLRVQAVIDDWDPRKLVNPIVETTEVMLPAGARVMRKQLKRSDLVEFIADVEAAEVLGKAFFWEMQAGSDFRRLTDGRYVGTACATCHYSAGADARTRHATRIPYVVWDKYPLAPGHPLKSYADETGYEEKQLPYDVRYVATHDTRFDDVDRFGFLSLIVASAGVEPRRFKGFSKPAFPLEPGAASEDSELRSLPTCPQDCYPEWSMFVDQKTGFRQITRRNSPTVINSGFADRQFYDGRAESTFNGFSIFGDRDKNFVLHRGVPLRNDKGEVLVDENGSPRYGTPVPVQVALTKASLASQAVGPVISEIEMSYLGRSFPNLAHKLLTTPVLAAQEVRSDDSLLGPWSDRIGLQALENGTGLTYEQLIRVAFRREWWDSGVDEQGQPNTVPLVMMGDEAADRAARGSLLVGNFSLYWGLSIMLYEASLVSNQSPFDGMMLGNPTLVEERWEQERERLSPIYLDRAVDTGTPAPAHQTGTAVFQHGFRVFLNRGCVECHSGPLFSEIYERHPDDRKIPIDAQLSNTLFPNSRSDAIAIRREAFQERILKEVAAILTQAPFRYPLPQAMQIARQLDVLRETAAGNVKRLQELVLKRLQSATDKPVEAAAQTIAERLMFFEKTAPLHYGNRPFFSEDERVALAERLTIPVLVEQMAIPPDQVASRPPFPIFGGGATVPYAFYDLGFYAIAVTPPRYDRGNGGRQASERCAPSDADFISSAYRMRPQYANIEAFLEGKPDIDPGTKLAQQLDSQRVAAEQSRKLSEGPRETSEDGARQPQPGTATDPCHAADTSWDRIDIPADVRRSSLVFFSRSRTLVTDEEPWGFRKPFLHDNELSFWGAFKTPTLRNIELTAPFMHNGAIASLSDVIEFYDQGGFFERDRETNPDLHPKMKSLDMTDSDQKALEFFLLCLTDERVRREAGPFDHPSLLLVNGYDEQYQERIKTVPAVGRNGS